MQSTIPQKSQPHFCLKLRGGPQPSSYQLPQPISRTHTPNPVPVWCEEHRPWMENMLISMPNHRGLATLLPELGRRLEVGKFWKFVTVPWPEIIKGAVKAVSLYIYIYIQTGIPNDCQFNKVCNPCHCCKPRMNMHIEIWICLKLWWSNNLENFDK